MASGQAFKPPVSREMVLGVLAFLAVALVGILLAGNGAPLVTSSPKPASQAPLLQTAASPVPTESPFWSKYPDLMARLKQYTMDPYAQSVRRCQLPPEVFSKLPPFPKDFDVNRLLFSLGKISDANYYREDTWKQPEFYPQWEEQGCGLHGTPPAGRWAAVGYGSYPSEVIVQSKRTDDYNVTFFMHTSWLVQTYQGMGFSILYPARGTLKLSEFSDGTRGVTVDPAETQKYFNATVSPMSMLLEPAFPVFEPGWTQKVTVNVKAKDAKPGRYLIGVDLGGPSKEDNDAWFYTYKLNYVTSGGTSIGEPWFTMFIEVQ